MKKVIKLLLKNFVNKYIDDRICQYLLTNHSTLFRLEYRSMLWEVAYNDKIEKLVKELDVDLKIYCYMDSILGKSIYIGEFELTEQVFLRRFLKSGELFIDIGANIGLFSLIASKKVGNTGKVIAFEPTPITFSRLKENCELNKLTNIECLQLAVSNKHESLPFYISNSGYDAWNSFTKDSIDKNRLSVEVNTVIIDELNEIGIDITQAAIIKIDVEGWETKVLQGGSKSLSGPNAPALIIEFTDQNAIQAGTSCQELYTFLCDLGYFLFTYNSETNSLIPDKRRKEYPYVNILATKNPDLMAKRLRQE